MASPPMADQRVRGCRSYVSKAMERLAQYWDDVDDLLGIVALCAERMRRWALFLVVSGSYILATYAAVKIALQDAPLALAIATVLLVLLIYRSVTALRPAVAGP